MPLAECRGFSIFYIGFVLHVAEHVLFFTYVGICPDFSTTSTFQEWRRKHAPNINRPFLKRKLYFDLARSFLAGATIFNREIDFDDKRDFDAATVFN